MNDRRPLPYLNHLAGGVSSYPAAPQPPILRQAQDERLRGYPIPPYPPIPPDG